MKYIIFDVDGTLIDSEQMYWQALKEVVEKNGYLITYDKFHKTFGKTMKDCLELLQISLDLVPMWQKKLAKYNNTITLFKDVRNVLIELLEDEHVYTGIATSETIEEFQNNVASLNISQYFNKLTFFSEVKKGKPFPDMIELSVQKLSTLDETREIEKGKCIYIGDTYSDLMAAHAANILFGLAGWSTSDVQRKLCDEADYVFERPTDILEIVR